MLFFFYSSKLETNTKLTGFGDCALMSLFLLIINKLVFKNSTSFQNCYTFSSIFSSYNCKLAFIVIVNTQLEINSAESAFLFRHHSVTVPHRTASSFLKNTNTLNSYVFLPTVACNITSIVTLDSHGKYDRYTNRYRYYLYRVFLEK